MKPITLVGTCAVMLPAMPAVAQTAEAESGPVAWVGVGIGILVLLGALVLGTWRYSSWKKHRSHGEEAAHEAKTRELYHKNEK